MYLLLCICFYYIYICFYWLIYYFFIRVFTNLHQTVKLASLKRIEIICDIRVFFNDINSFKTFTYSVTTIHSRGTIYIDTEVWQVFLRTATASALWCCLYSFNKDQYHYMDLTLKDKRELLNGHHAVCVCFNKEKRLIQKNDCSDAVVFKNLLNTMYIY